MTDWNYITANEACELLGVSADTFRKIVQREQLTSVPHPTDARVKLFEKSAVVAVRRQPVVIQTRHRVITLSNNKGGVSKTTSAINLAGEAALEGFRTLLVDACPQASATRALLDASLDQLNDRILFSWLSGRKNFEDLIQKIEYKEYPLDFIASTPQNDQIDRSNPLEIVPALREFFECWDDSPYDYIFIDTDPSFGTLVSMAQVGSHYILCPVQADVLSVDGTAQLVRQLARARALTRGVFPALLGFFLSRFTPRRRVCQEALETLRANYPGLVFEASIPDNVRVTESPSQKAPINLTAPDSKGAAAYRDLWQEVKDRVSKANLTP
jgi:chromosome partitioning protein